MSQLSDDSEDDLNTHLLMVIPEDVRRRLRAVADTAGEVDSASLVYVKIWPSEYRGRRNCKQNKTL